MTDIDLNHRAQLGTLWRLRGKLTLRQFGRERGRIIGAVVVLLFFGPIVLGMAIGTGIGYRQLEGRGPSILLGAVLTILWLIWLAFPIMFSSLNEGADITRLLLYPLKRRTLITAVVLGTLFDYPTYLMLPLFLAIIVGFGLTVSPVAIIVLVALALAYGHLIMIGQFVSTAVGGIMQSRRVRDVAIVLASTLGGLCYFVNIGIQQLLRNVTAQFSAADIEMLQNFDALTLLQWLPPGASARAIERAVAADWAVSGAWLLYSLTWLALITWSWYKLLVRLTTGEGYLITPRPQEEAQRKEKKQARRETNWLGWLPDDMAQLVVKELKFTWRIPQRRVGVIQGVLMPMFFMGAFFFSGDFGGGGFGRFPDWAGLVAPLYGLFLFWANSQNMLAWEGDGLPTLLLTPVKREHIFWAKGLTLFVVTAVPVLFFGVIFIYFMQDWVSLIGVLTSLCIGFTTLAVTSVTSVLFPMPIQLEAKRNRSLFQSGGDTKTGCAYLTLVPMSVAVMGLPMMVPLVIAYWQDWPWFAFLGLGLSLAYALAIFWGGSKLATGLLLEREPELIARMKLPDDA